MEKKLERSRKDAVLGGVAAGMGEYFGIDKTIVRILWALSLFLPLPPSFGWTIIIYIIMWAVLPEKSDYFTANQGFGGPANDNESVRPASVAPNDPALSPNNSIKILGGILLAIGAYMLLDEVVYWYEFRQYLWPIILIGIGAYLLLKQRDDETLKRQGGSQTDTFTPDSVHTPSTQTPEPVQTEYTVDTPASAPSGESGTDNPDAVVPEDDQKNKPEEDGEDPVIKVN